VPPRLKSRSQIGPKYSYPLKPLKAQSQRPFTHRRQIVIRSGVFHNRVICNRPKRQGPPVRFVSRPYCGNGDSSASSFCRQIHPHLRPTTSSFCKPTAAECRIGKSSFCKRPTPESACESSRIRSYVHRFVLSKTIRTCPPTPVRFVNRLPPKTASVLWTTTGHRIECGYSKPRQASPTKRETRFNETD
jgi:hypothetical protein